MARFSTRTDIPDAIDLATRVEGALGQPPVYLPDFELVTEDGKVLEGGRAVAVLSMRGPQPVLNAVVGEGPEEGLLLIYERISSATRFGEPWPAPAASVIELDENLKVVKRRDYGGFVVE